MKYITLDTYLALIAEAKKERAGLTFLKETLQCEWDMFYVSLKLGTDKFCVLEEDDD